MSHSLIRHLLLSCNLVRFIVSVWLYGLVATILQWMWLILLMNLSLHYRWLRFFLLFGSFKSRLRVNRYILILIGTCWGMLGCLIFLSILLLDSLAALIEIHGLWRLYFLLRNLQVRCELSWSLCIGFERCPIRWLFPSFRVSATASTPGPRLT